MGNVICNAKQEANIILNRLFSFSLLFPFLKHVMEAQAERDCLP